MRTAYRLKNVGACLLGLVALAGCAARQPGAPLNPGFNVYSKEQDIQLGQQAAQEVRQQMEVVNNPQLKNYVESVGRRLAMTSAAADYPYSFDVLNDKSINAFALPGGPIFVNSGLISSAENEAQMAGVLAHEIGHIALRHGTSQASKANLLSIPAQLAGAIFGQSAAGQIGALGVGLGAQLLTLKYSRSAESEADAIGTRIMAEAGYDPQAMARFFAKLEETGGGGAPEFLSDHPNPGNRMQAVQAEIRALPQRQYQAERSNGNFEQAQRLAASLPAPRRSQQQVLAEGFNANGQPPQASGQLTRAENQRFSVNRPSNWETFATQDGSLYAIAPRAGLMRGAGGNIVVGYGALASYYRPQSRVLRDATRELLTAIQQGDASIQIGDTRQITVQGAPALVTQMAGRSPYGGREMNTVLTIMRPQGLFYMVFVAPEQQAGNARAVFDQMLSSLQFRS